MGRSGSLRIRLPREAKERLAEAAKALGLPLCTLIQAVGEERFRLLWEEALRFHEDEVRAMGFLARPNPALGGRTPLEVASSDEGLEEVLRVVQNLEEGVFL